MVSFASSARTLGVVLMLHGNRGSFAIAGLAVGSSSLGASVLAPLRGRLVDRIGQRRVLMSMAVPHFAAWTVLALKSASLPAAGVVLLALFGGASFPPVFAATRSTWSSAFRDDPAGRSSIYALTSVTQNVALVLGPVGAAAVAATLRPSLAVIGAASITLLGTILFVSTELSRAVVPHARPAARRITGPLAERRVQLLVAGMLCYGVAIGTLNVSVPFVATVHRSHSSGLLLAIFALGDIVGAIIYGSASRTAHARPVQLALSFGLFGVTGTLMALGSAYLPLLALLLLLSGAVSSPILLNVFHLLDDVAPDGMATESFTWIASGQLLGVAVGAYIVGYLTQHGSPHVAFAPTAIGAVLGCGLFVVSRKLFLKGQAG
jgi:MFS family permease